MFKLERVLSTFFGGYLAAVLIVFFFVGYEHGYHWQGFVLSLLLLPTFGVIGGDQGSLLVMALIGGGLYLIFLIIGLFIREPDVVRYWQIAYIAFLTLNLLIFLYQLLI